MKCLGFDVPPSSLSLDGEVTEVAKDAGGGSRRRRSVALANTSGAQDDSSRASKRFKATDFNDPSFRCEKCQYYFPSRQQLNKHQCSTSTSTNSIEAEDIVAKSSDNVTENTSSDGPEEGGKKQCLNCKEWFALQGGWHTKHVKNCPSTSTPATTTSRTSSSATSKPTPPPQSSSSRESLVSIVSTPSAFTISTPRQKALQQQAALAAKTTSTPVFPTDKINKDSPSTAGPSDKTEKVKKKCNKCGESFCVNGGWYSKHIAVCQQDQSSLIAEPTSTTSLESAISTSRTSSCPKCGKEYSPHVRRFLDAHIETCDGTNVSYSNINNIPTSPTISGASISNDLNNTAEVDPDLIVSLFASNLWRCYKCAKDFTRRDILRQHLLTHFRDAIKDKYMKSDDTNDIADSLQCVLCKAYLARDEKSLLQHIAIAVHYKLKEFLPEKMGGILFTKSNAETSINDTTNSSDNNANASSANEDEPVKKSVSVRLPILQKHKWKCCVCSKILGNRPDLTVHVVEHFKQQVLDDYVESGSKCSICKYSDPNLGQLTRHVALQHEKIRVFLPPEEGDRLFEEPEVNSTADTSLASADISMEQDQVVDTTMTSNEKPLLICYICAKATKARSELRQHIFCHLKNEVMKKYFGEEGVVTKQCPECKYKSSVAEHVLMHFALKHKYLREFVPPDVAELLYDSSKKDSQQKQQQQSHDTSKTDSATNDHKKKAKKDKKDQALVSCQRCKKKFKSKKVLMEHLVQCVWNCPKCKIDIVGDSKAIKKHKAACSSPKKESFGSPELGNNFALSCFLCMRGFNQFNYLKGHMSMHYRDDLKSKVSDWPGGLGGTGFTCNLCDFVAQSQDSLVTHAGYKHALFLAYMSIDQRIEFYQMASRAKEIGNLPPITDFADSVAGNQLSL